MRTRALTNSSEALGSEISARKLTEEVEKQNEDRVPLIINTIPAMAWTVQPDGTVDFVNQRWLDYTGLTLEEQIEDPARAIHPEDIPRVMEKWLADMAVGESYEDEMRLRRSDGEFRWFLVRTTPLRDKRGNVVKWFGLSIDIEDRKRAEHDFTRQKEILQTIFDNVPAMIGFVGPDGRIKLANREWERTLGWTLEEVLQQNLDVFAELYPDPKYREEVLNFVFKSNAEWADFRTRVRDGRVIDTIWANVHLSDGTTIGIGRDVTERKRAERESRRLIDAIPHQIWSGPPDGTIDYCNERWRSDTGLALEDARDKGWLSIIHPDDRDRVINAWRDSVANGTPYEQEERHRKADGTYRWFLSRGVPLRDAKGHILRWYGTNTDIEDCKRAEEALRSSEREQRQIAAELQRERGRLVEAQDVAKMGRWEAELQDLNVIWSEQTHRIFETDPSRFEPTRPKFCEFIHPEDRARVDAAFLASLDKRSPSTVEYRIVMPDGRVKILEEHWQAFHDEEGKPVRVAGTCRDVSERVRAEEELRRLSGQLLRLQDEERRKTARDLHDSMGQDLVALATMLGQLRGSIPSEERKARRFLSECKALAEGCIRKVRTLSYLLHPPMLDAAGLNDTIRDYVKGFTRRSGIQVELELSPRVGRLSRDIELALFRVVQESLTNIQRHSGSPRAKIRVHRNSELTLEITDFGRGLSAAKQIGKDEARLEVGVGIRSMQERAELIGGRLEIDSTRHGTTVRLTIPLRGGQREKTAHSRG
jgi:PAS domain S-box-containing protein